MLDGNFTPGASARPVKIMMTVFTKQGTFKGEMIMEDGAVLTRAEAKETVESLAKVINSLTYVSVRDDDGSTIVFPGDLIKESVVKFTIVPA